MSNVIDIKDLQFYYPKASLGASPDVLRIPDFQVESAERVFLYGPSGSGKTTFLEVLAGILRSQKGSVRILGKDLSSMLEKERDLFRGAHLGYIFQSFNLIPYLNVQENIELPLHLSPARRARIQGEDLTKMIRYLCDRLGIGTLLERRVTALSIGQQQRVAVARALVGRPELILADEPTSSLDMDHREKFLQLLFDLCTQHGTTLLFVSHDRSLQHLFSRAVSLESINQTSQQGSENRSETL
jgi:putative ABC transport system ATP-binding protein